MADERRRHDAVRLSHDACVPAAPRPMHETVETDPCASGHVNVRSVARKVALMGLPSGVGPSAVTSSKHVPVAPPDVSQL